MFIITAFIMED